MWFLGVAAAHLRRRQRVYLTWMDVILCWQLQWNFSRWINRRPSNRVTSAVSLWQRIKWTSKMSVREKMILSGFYSDANIRLFHLISSRDFNIKMSLAILLYPTMRHVIFFVRVFGEKKKVFFFPIEIKREATWQQTFLDSSQKKTIK